MWLSALPGTRSAVGQPEPLTHELMAGSTPRHTPGKSPSSKISNSPRVLKTYPDSRVASSAWCVAHLKSKEISGTIAA